MFRKTVWITFLTTLMVSVICLPLTPAVSATTVDTFPRVSVIYPDTVHASAAETTVVPVTLSVHEGWHVNSNDPLQDYLIPTKLSLKNKVLTLREVNYPPGERYNFSFSGTEVVVYSGTVQLPATIEIPPLASLRKSAGNDTVSTLDFQLDYQACTDKKCSPPERVHFSSGLEIQSDSGRIKKASGGGTGSVYSLSGSDTLASGVGRTNRVKAAFEDYGLLLGLGFVFFLGLMLNLTPCVYPMIPITIGYFGSKDSDSYGQRIADAFMFVFGMALIYTFFGTLAGMTRNVLGQALQQPVVLISLAGVMVLLAASNFGLYEIRVPSSVRRGSEKLSQGLGTIGMGMTMGVAAAPCLAPATVTLLAYISQQHDAYMGGLLFFVLSLGLGLPYLLLAVFASGLSDLPVSGNWLEWINQVIGFAILGAAVYFVWPLISLKVFGYLLILLTLAAAIVLGVSHPPENRMLYFARGLALALVAVFFISTMSSSFLVAYEGIDWIPAEKLVELEPNLVQGPTMVYVSAEWCAPCKEMKIKTFQNNALRRELEPVTPVKVDLTEAPDSKIGNWMDKHSIQGVPTILFLTSDGREVRSLRTVGFVGPATLLNKVRVFKRRVGI
ncbi:MAG: cytochrome c biogenesis protein CcdA [bacterium]